MPFTVTGTFDDGAAYAVQITGRAVRPVIGSRRIAALVELHQGRRMPLSATGPLRMVDPEDEASVLAVLREFTSVVDEGAGAPRRAEAPRD
ncbi:hypothetical protein ACGFYQ_34170 [Streptomyces sp. NPDC048258]|uniref:hypothetical protein n=1 Tax=Streptomyces sp. NPDC048258 TaxID=3365527 RepID=UPI003719894D